ncbi:hypothetical protein N2152v2_011062 [Parachlorella kessleri]
MPPAAQPAAAGNGNAQGGQQQQRGGGMIGGILRAAMMWYMFKTFMGGNKQGGQQGAGAPGAAPPLAPRFAKHTPMDAHFFISEEPSWRAAARSSDPVWVASDVELAGGKEQRYTYVYRPSHAVQHNGSVWVHAVFTPPGASPSPKDDFFDKGATFARSRELVAYLPKPKAKEGVNLLSGKNSTDGKASQTHSASNETVIVSYFKPNVTLAVVDDFSNYPAKAIPPQYKDVLAVDESTMTYWPHMWFNEFWLLRDHMVLLNDTVQEIPMHFELYTMSNWKFAILVQASGTARTTRGAEEGGDGLGTLHGLDQSFSMQKSWGAMGEGESDEVKRIFLEGNPVFLGLTMVVSMLHSVFDILAFKNDIGFWKDKKNVQGLSVRTILINCFCQLVIFLYLLDSDTSMVVLFSAGVGTAIEFWKVTKAMKVSVVWLPSGLPWLEFKDRASYTKTKTQEYDAQAMRYLSYALYPLVGGYAVYALVYQTHKSWYSWILNSLVGAVYTFGFILMCPQLYLNYKLKSVAHLPWRQMTYKFLNTIIDDLFAFVIKMPLLHRLSVFRDDLVFLIYLYQRWVYRVDKKRANEFGYAEEQPDIDDEKEDQQQAKDEAEEKREAAKASKDNGKGKASQAGGKKEAGADAAAASSSVSEEQQVQESKKEK